MSMIEKIKINKAGVFFPILALFIMSEQCRQTVANRSKEIVAYSIMSDWELVKTEDGSLFNLKDTFIAAQKNNTCMYVIYKPYVNTYITYDKNDSIVSERSEEGVNYNYYLFNSMQRVGVKYDSFNTKKGIEFPVDSLIAAKNFFKSDINLDSGYTLIRKAQVEKFSEVEIYHANHRPDEDFPDSIYLTFSSKFDKVPYSFSKKIDSIHQKKLFKIQIIYNPLKNEKFSFPLPRRELLFEIKKVSVQNKKDINNLFKRFEKTKPIIK